MNTFRKKPILQLINQSSDDDKILKKTLNSSNLISLGIGSIIGAGLFVRTAAAAGEYAGPAVTISYIIASIGCAFSSLCYAEFASMIPVAGSAYTYAYATLGEFVAWIIGWFLILEYALGAATVSIAWSEYLNNLLGGAIPYNLCHSPFDALKDSNGAVIENGFMNIPAVLILFFISALLIKGTHESANINTIMVFIKIFIILIFIVIGWGFIKPENHTPYIIPPNTPGHEGVFQHGWGGILRGAGIVFFAFIGFDAVSTAAQETKNPKRDMPIGILGSLIICTILYVLFSYVLTGISPYADFVKAGKEASVAYAIKKYMPGYEWLSTLITIAILAGFSSVILVMLMGQSRILYSMANDGLLPKIFSDLHPTFYTPYKSNIILFLFVGIFAAFVPGNITGDLTSMGTLFAFISVNLGVWLLRINNPELNRPFKTPLVPLVPILGILVCIAMIISLPSETHINSLIWMIIGIIVYFMYGNHYSKLNTLK
jgi:APA family basic amino acid/polyamine antiporter